VRHAGAVFVLASLVPVACGPAGDHAARGTTVDRPADAGGGQAATAPTSGLTGVLASESKAPIADAMVLACQARTCLYGNSDAHGRFSFDIPAPANVALKTLERDDAIPRWGAALVPVHLDRPTLVDLGTVYVPTLPAGTPLPPAGGELQPIAAGDGLELTIRRADLTPRLGDLLFDVAARRVADVGPYRLPALAAEEVLAVYAVHPFAATSLSPIGVRAALAVPAGTAVRFRSISEIDGHLSPAVPGRADGSSVATDPGTGLLELTYIIVSK
jgi:hypothetical protein